MSGRTIRAFLCIGTVLSIAVCVAVTPAAAQSPVASQQDGKWEIEVHGGRMLATSPTGGTRSLPAAGAPFPTAVGMPSRRETSLDLCDGAGLLKDADTARRATAKITAP